MAKLVWTEESERWLKDIFDYIALDNPDAAASVLDGIYDGAQALLSSQDMNLPGIFLHELKGSIRGVWSVRVSGNWRETIKFDGPDAVDVNYEDYH